MGKTVINCGGITYSSKDYSLFYREVNNVLKNISKQDIKKIFNIKFKGHEFNCLPFLLNGTGYFSETYRSSLVKAVCKAELITKPFHFSDLKKSCDLDFDVFGGLYPSTSDLGIRSFGAFLYSKNPMELVKLLCRGSIEVVEEVIFNAQLIHFDYKYDKICNTQAFSYYISILWLMSLSPLLGTSIRKDLNRVKFKELIYSLCPEESIQFKYITGELSGKELKSKYIEKSFEDGSSIALREVMSNATSGDYTGEDLSSFEVGLMQECFDMNTCNEEYKLNEHLAYCYLFNGTYEKILADAMSSEMSIERYKDDALRYKDKLSRLQKESSSYKSNLTKLESEVSMLTTRLNNCTTNEELENRIKELEHQVKSLESENNSLFKERLELKQTISSQIKEIKSLSSRVVEEIDDTSELESNSDDIEQPTMEDMISVLEDKKLILVGGDRNSFLEQNLMDLGIKNVSRFNSNARTLGKCDYVIVFTIRCCHSDVYRAEKLAKGKKTELVYYNGVNIDGLIPFLYNEITSKIK